jgi:hypothetical protein
MPGFRGARIVSDCQIRLNRRKSARIFKGIFCSDISEFESSEPSPVSRVSVAYVRSAKIYAPCPGVGEMRRSLYDVAFLVFGHNGPILGVSL